MFVLVIDAVSGNSSNSTGISSGSSLAGQIAQLDIALLRQKGDINGDGFIDRDDRERLQRGIIAGNLTPEEMAVADINEDGKIDFEGDVPAIFKLVFGTSIASIKEVAEGETRNNGDLDGDGDIDQRDYWALEDSRLANKRGLLTDGQKAVVDVNHDGEIDPTRDPIGEPGKSTRDLKFMGLSILEVPLPGLSGPPPSDPLILASIKLITSRIFDIALRVNNKGANGVNNTGPKLEELKADLFNNFVTVTGIDPSDKSDTRMEAVMAAIRDRKDVNDDGIVNTQDIIDEFKEPYLGDINHLTQKMMIEIQSHAHKEEDPEFQAQIQQLGGLLEKNTGIKFDDKKAEDIEEFFEAVRKNNQELLAVLDLNNDKVFGSQEIKNMFTDPVLRNRFRALDAIQVLTGKLIKDAKNGDLLEDGKLSDKANELVNDLIPKLAIFSGKPMTDARKKAIKSFLMKVAKLKGKGPDKNGDKKLTFADFMAVWESAI